MKKKRITIICICFAIIAILAGMFYLNRAIIFQRGNPIPYLIAVAQISEKQPYVAVDKSEGIYISKRGECSELFEDFQEQLTVDFVEQAGSSYIFADEVNHYVISSEIYWGRYTVWQLPEVIESPEVSKENERLGATTFIVEIRDRAKEEQLPCDDAEEMFYADETKEYYFGSIKSHYIIVNYNNGNSEDIVTALNAGRATIEDLDKFEIGYFTEFKK